MSLLKRRLVQKPKKPVNDGFEIRTSRRAAFTGNGPTYVSRDRDPVMDTFPSVTLIRSLLIWSWAATR